MQFENLTTLYDQNIVVRSLGGHVLPTIDKASDVGGDGDFFYPGVTHRQFNEAQILKNAAPRLSALIYEVIRSLIILNLNI